MIRKRKNREAWYGLLFVCVLASIAGCDKFGKAPAPQPQQAQPLKPAVAPVMVQKQVSSVKLPPAQVNQFDFSTKKDPFKPFVSIKAATPADLKRMPAKDALPLHSFDVSQFRLIGTVADPKGNKAMVVDPTGKAYVLKPGMTIGKNEGKITQISSNGVDVVEQFRDDNNKLRKETIRIPLLRKP